MTIQYLSIQDSNVTPSGSFTAINSVNSSNNSGWLFATNAPAYARLTRTGNLLINNDFNMQFDEVNGTRIQLSKTAFYAEFFDEVTIDPTFISSATAQDVASSTTITINIPPGTIDGDLMVAYVSGTSSSPTWTPPGGWTVISTTGGAWFGYKSAASEGASYTFTSSSSDTQSGFILTFRNASYDVASTYSTAANPSSTPSITVSKDNSLEVVIAITQGVAATGQTYTGPAGFTQIAADRDSTAPSWAVFSKLVTAGSTGTVSITGTLALSNQRSIQLALSPILGIVPMRQTRTGNVFISGIFDETQSL